MYYKLKDIRLLYEGFQDYLRERYITKEELLDVLNSQVKESELLKNSVVVLDGFTGFTGAEPADTGTYAVLQGSLGDSYDG